MADHEEYAPALGGSRAQPEPPPPVETPPPPPPPLTGAASDELPPELAAFLGPLGRLAELFADAGNAPDASVPGATPRPPYVPGQPDGAIDALLNDALRSFADRLTPALAAFGTIVDAVEEAITPLIDDMGNRLAAQAETRAQQVEAATQEAEGEVYDAVPMEEEIPPVDLPPGA